MVPLTRQRNPVPFRAGTWRVAMWQRRAERKWSEWQLAQDELEAEADRVGTPVASLSQCQGGFVPTHPFIAPQAPAACRQAPTVSLLVSGTVPACPHVLEGDDS